MHRFDGEDVIQILSRLHFIDTRRGGITINTRTRTTTFGCRVSGTWHCRLGCVGQLMAGGVTGRGSVVQSVEEVLQTQPKGGELRRRLSLYRGCIYALPHATIGPSLKSARPTSGNECNGRRAVGFTLSCCVVIACRLCLSSSLYYCPFHMRFQLCLDMLPIPSPHLLTDPCPSLQ